MSEWNRRVEESIKQERKEAEARYGIRIGQTELYCTRCGKSCTPGHHTCQDIRFQHLQGRKRDVLLPDHVPGDLMAYGAS